VAKLKAPLFSLGASQQLGKALVFFGWKGLNVVREYVIPSNPRTTLQNAQRARLTSVVTLLHSVMGVAGVWSDKDTTAYGLWASVVQSATTWFNQVVRHGIDQLILGRAAYIFSEHNTTPGSNELAVQVRFTYGDISGGDFKYGTSKTALINSKAADDYTGGLITATIPNLTPGVKYFWQFVGTAPADAVGAKSGIGYGVPTT